MLLTTKFYSGFLCRALAIVFVWRAAAALTWASEQVPERGSLQAGAAVVDVSPQRLPIAVNGGMTAAFASEVKQPVKARAIVMQQTDVRVAIVVVDSCMLPRQLLDETKHMAAQRTGIRSDHIMIAATHTHTAPAAMSCLGTDADPDYQAYLRVKIVEVIELALSRLVPAEVAFGAVRADHFMAIRRWILRPDRKGQDPFGNFTVRANMHAGRNWDDVTGESGPEDPELSIMAVRQADGVPIAVLANLSMHYFSGVSPIDADYFGRYAEGLEQRLREKCSASESCVAMMSHGCSGDVWRMDYTKQTPPEFDSIDIDTYTNGLLDLTMEAYGKLEFAAEVPLQMVERRLPMRYRLPDQQLLEWSQRIVEGMGDRLPQTTTEVYAREQLYLHAMRETEVVVQAMRVGDCALATTPTETYALTGLKIKGQSPFRQTIVFDLTNGGDGYIPPPEQHELGGYNTWPARSAGLEVNAEPKIVESVLQMLEELADRPRRHFDLHQGRSLDPERTLGYWPMDDSAGPLARDISLKGRDGVYEPGVVFFLAGEPRWDAGAMVAENRAAHFVGGRMRVRVGQLPENYAVTLSIWNGMPNDAREVAGWCYSRGSDFGRPRGAEQLGVAGTGTHAGKLILQLGDEPPVFGKTTLQRWQWYRVRLERYVDRIEVYLVGNREPEIVLQNPQTVPAWVEEIFWGGASDRQSTWEGRLDEIVLESLEANVP